MVASASKEIYIRLFPEEGQPQGGLFKIGDEESSSLYWGKNRWLMTADRDSLRHYFLHKTYCRKQDLSKADEIKESSGHMSRFSLLLRPGGFY